MLNRLTMKRILTSKKLKDFLFLLFLFINYSIIYAKHVPESEARKVGYTFLSKRANSQLSNESSLNLVYQEKYNKNVLEKTKSLTLFYIFNSSNNEFVIVSGDDCVLPILGYSKEKQFNPDSIPYSTKKWLEDYIFQIRYVIDNELSQNNSLKIEWETLKEGKVTDNIEKSSVLPLVQTKWNQNPYYNDLCPPNTVTGCVATAMAQIMKYWNFPNNGSGFHSYNHPTLGTISANFGGTTYQWGSMPNIVNSSNYSVATLMYHCGVSVDMQYGAVSTGGSSAQTLDVENALKNYFGYKTTVDGVSRINYTEIAWTNLIKSELNASRPIQYAATGNGGGHSFVCDGYDNNDMFHFNWGWGGNSDGYFQINLLNPSALGTGGGTGGFYSNHRAIVGIEPPSNYQSFSLSLYANVTPSSSTIYYGNAFNINTNIANTGTNTFNGDYTVAIFDQSLNFIDYVQTLSGTTLQGNSTYSSNLIFSTSGILGMLPGTYYACVFYRPTGGNWIQVPNYNSFTNMIQLNVINPNDIELNSQMTISPSVLTVGQSASINLNIVNDGNETFIGQYSVGLYKLDGTFAQSINVISDNVGLPSTYTYQSPFLTFSTNAINVSPGTYLLAAQHKKTNGNWELTGSSYYQNPRKVTVIAAPIQPDIYENNNNLNQSFNLPINFNGNSSVKNTTGSNFHIGTDNDFYKIILPSGFNYTLTPRIHDSYNSGNGNSYTVDAIFSYSTNGSTWSNSFDDIISSNILMNNGGTIYFKVVPYFQGQTGTYLLSININRTQISTNDILELIDTDLVKVYPNPAEEIVNIDLSELETEINTFEIYNLQGQLITKIEPETIENLKIKISIESFKSGVYLIKLKTKDSYIIKKLVVN